MNGHRSDPAIRLGEPRRISWATVHADREPDSDDVQLTGDPTTGFTTRFDIGLDVS
jgi:hypothetical protein